MSTERKNVSAIIGRKNVSYFCKQNKKINKNKEIKITKTKKQKFRYRYKRHVYGFEFVTFLKAFYFNFLHRLNFNFKNFKNSYHF